MKIPPKRTGKKSKYDFDRLHKRKKLFFPAEDKQLLSIKSCASLWAKRNGAEVTTRIGVRAGAQGIYVFLVE
jgi:hypothetical protein